MSGGREMGAQIDIYSLPPRIFFLRGNSLAPSLGKTHLLFFSPPTPPPLPVREASYRVGVPPARRSLLPSLCTGRGCRAKPEVPWGGEDGQLAAPCLGRGGEGAGNRRRRRLSAVTARTGQTTCPRPCSAITIGLPAQPPSLYSRHHVTPAAA